MPETSGLGLLDYLVKPFQRVLKYPLLLRVRREKNLKFVIKPQKKS